MILKLEKIPRLYELGMICIDSFMCSVTVVYNIGEIILGE